MDEVARLAPAVINGGGLIVAVFAGFIGIRAATTEVRNDQDKFIDDLRRQGRRAAWAASWAAAAAVLTALAEVLRWVF